MELTTGIRLERIVGLIAAFSALSMSLGYVYDIGYLSAIDSRLLQFLALSDFLAAATSHVFTLLVSVLLILGFWIFNVFAKRGLAFEYYNLLVSDDVPDESLARRFWRLEFGILTFLLIVVGILAVSYAFWGGNWFTPTITGISSTGIVIVSMLEGVRSTPSVATRRAVVGALGGLALFSFVYYYGDARGQIVSGSMTNDLTLYLSDGRMVNCVLIHKFADGISYKEVGDAKPFYVPNAKIARIQLD